jgi:hypothetical protein
MLIAIAVIMVIAAPRGYQRQSLSPIAPASTPANPTRPSDQDINRLAIQMEAAAVAALQRAAPGAILESGETSFTIGPGQGYGVYLFIRANARLGGLRVHASRSRHEPCEGFSPNACRRVAGPHGEVITIAHFDRQVPADQPRATETRAAVYRPSGSRVQISIDNAAAVFSPQNLPPHTGHPPPLTEAQAVAMASDPTLDFCATTSEGPCAPG